MSTSAIVGGSIASGWRELHGESSWKGLLDPLDIELRTSIIAYGELAQATYDGFNSEKRSPHAGACLYGHDDLLASVDVPSAGHYAVTKFVYATSALPLPDAFLLLPLPGLPDTWSRESNWMGYVAVATDEGAAALGRRDIIAAWRGTIKNLEWVNDLDFTPVLGSRRDDAVADAYEAEDLEGLASEDGRPGSDPPCGGDQHRGRQSSGRHPGGREGVAARAPGADSSDPRAGPRY